jgi:hypothetical protein
MLVDAKTDKSEKSDDEPDVIKLIVSQLPACVICLLIEHIAVAKTFGRVNNIDTAECFRHGNVLDEETDHAGG